MKVLKSVKEYFALDIGSSALRIVQLDNKGNTHKLLRYGAMQLDDTRLAISDASADQRKLGELIRQLVDKTVATNNVIVGIPTSRLFVTVVDLPKLAPQEMATSIKYQAEQFIPQAIDDVKLDWAILGESFVDKTKNEVLLVSSANKFIEARLDMLENIGLNVISMEPEAIAITRSLLPVNAPGSYMIIDIGEVATDTTFILDGMPRIVRATPTGLQAMIKSATQGLSIDNEQAKQYIFKFGLTQDKLEGQIFRAIESTLQALVMEFKKSIKFFNDRYTTQPVSNVLLSGSSSAIPLLDQFLASQLEVNVSRANTWQNVSFNPGVQEQLLQLNDSFAVAVGLAGADL